MAIGKFPRTFVDFDDNDKRHWSRFVAKILVELDLK
jgi:hypothetical protein